LEWDAPKDTGCLPISSYKIEAFLNAQWQHVGTSLTTKGVANLASQVGVKTALRVTAINSIGAGSPSNSI
jgi:hypothetical protein